MRKLTTAAIIAASFLLIATTQATAEPEARMRDQYRSETTTDPAVAASLDAERARANLRASGEDGGTPTPVRAQSPAKPGRPIDCFYIPYGTSFTATGIPMLRYSDLRKWFKPGDKFGFQCHYVDDPDHRWTGDYVLGEEPPETVGARQAEAQAALNRWVEQGFPSPVVTGKPTLLDQRIAIATWFAVPTLTQVETAGQADLTLTARARPLVTFNVPVGRWGTETFECTASSVGPDGRPLDGTCSHAFQHATAGPTTATVTIAFDVTYSSTITGEVDVPVGPGSVTRTSQIPMQVKEIQAVGR